MQKKRAHRLGHLLFTSKLKTCTLHDVATLLPVYLSTNSFLFESSNPEKSRSGLPFLWVTGDCYSIYVQINDTPSSHIQITHNRQR